MGGEEALYHCCMSQQPEAEATKDGGREPGFQAWAQSTCPELSAQGLVPLRWGCALPSPNAPGKAPNHTTRISGSLSCGAREVRSPRAWQGAARPGSRVTGGVQRG